MLPLPPLHPIVDVDVATRAGWTPVDLAQACFDGGALLLQVRAKHLASGALLTLCEAVVRRASRYDALVIVNDRADVARLAGAAGAHVGQEDITPAAARRVLGDGPLLGLSTHTIDQARAARDESVSYLAIGPVFGTRTKDTGYTAVGLQLVRDVVQAVAPIPVVAIGGITLDTAPLVWEAGAMSVAVIGDLLATGDPAARVADYNRVALGRVGRGG